MPTFQDLHKPFDRQDYPPLENTTFEDLAIMFGASNGTLVCDDIVRMVNATVDANKTSTVDTLKMIVGSMEQGFRQTYVTVIFLILERRGHIELK